LGFRSDGSQSAIFPTQVSFQYEDFDGSTAEYAFSISVQAAAAVILFQEDFESGLSVPPWAQVSGNAVNALIVSDEYSQGSKALRLGTPNGLPDESGYSAVTLDVSAINHDANLAFDWRVDAENGSYDYLKVTISGTGIESLTHNFAGAYGLDSMWQSASIALPSGAESEEFRFRKDSSVTKGRDCAWLDAVKIYYFE